MHEILVITTLYPNSAQERHGIFVETRLRHLLATGEISATVVAPVPWVPFRSALFSGYEGYREIPSQTVRNGITVYHPRYVVIPKVGMLLTPFLMALSLWMCIRKLRQKGLSYDLVDGHYYYPDGVAIALLAKWLRKPYTVTARGTDINLIPEYKLPRKLILWAADKAAASITVCKALKDEMISIGANPAKIHVLRNGVDLELFRPLDRAACKNDYQISAPTLLSVGHLIDRKGHDLVIKAMSSLPECHLLIAGDGELEATLKQLVKELGLEQRVRFLGAVNQQQLARIYNAVDIMVLASSREGWANVLLESMACGTPVAASSIWGTPEVVATPESGFLFEQRTPEAIASTVTKLLNNYPDRKQTRAYAERFSWNDTIGGIQKLFRELTP